MSSDYLRVAAQSGDLESVCRLVEEEGVDVNTRLNTFEHTALHVAANNAQAEVVQFLLESKADVNVRDHLGNTSLHKACQRRRNIQVIQLLIDHKADIKARCNDGRTALHVAIRFSVELEVVQCLLDGNADVNITDWFGRTPLHRMGVLGIPAPGAVMELLLSHKVDLHVKDNGQSTPLHHLVARDSCIEAVRVILDHLSSNNDPAASPESALTCRDKSGCLPFHFVRNPEMAKLLLERPLLQDENHAVPRVCHEMLFAKDGGGKSLLDRQQGGAGPLFDYLASFTELPLITLPERTQTTVPYCEHRDKRPRHATVPFNSELNEFQRSIVRAFLNKWDHSFQQPGATVGADHEDLHAMLPDDVKYVIMAYLTPADIMKM